MALPRFGRVSFSHNTIIFLQAGLPNGVLNIVHISKEKNPELVPEIIAHPEIRHISVIYHVYVACVSFVTEEHSAVHRLGRSRPYSCSRGRQTFETMCYGIGG